jgi:hypothetical protein
MECITVASADGLTIRNSSFNNCAVFAIFVKELSESNLMRRITIENNFFGNTLAIDMSAMIKLTAPESQTPCTDVLIRNNTIVDKLVLTDCPGTNIRWESNILESLPASVSEDRPAGTTFDFNVIEEGAACGPNDLLVADALLVNREALDLHLLPGSPAIDRASPASSAHDDIDGDLRPQGGAPDAGADEFVFTP